MRTEPFREVQFSRMLIGLGVFIAVGSAIAVGAVFGPGSRILVAAVLLAVLGAMVWRTRLVVVVDAMGVRASAAHITWQWVSRAEALDAVAMRTALSTGAHPTDYLRVRSTKAGLRLWLDDPSDPHRCWVLSVRDLTGLQGALRNFDAKGMAHAS